MPRTLILPPSRPGSLGDAAMVAGARARFGGVVQDWDRSWPRRGGRVVLIGADVIDGRYDEAFTRERLRAVADARVPAAIVSASFGQDARPYAVELLRSMPHVPIECRDPLSAARLEEALQRPVTWTPDLAFVAHRRRAARARPARRHAIRHVGVCVNRLAARTIGCDRATLLAVVVDLLDAIGEGCVVTVFAHDRRGDDDELAERAARASDAGHAAPATWQEAADLIAGVDVLISMRMHAAIAAIARGTPVVAMDYAGGKVAGLGAAVGDPGLAFPAELLLDDPGEVVRRADLRAQAYASSTASAVADQGAIEVDSASARTSGESAITGRP